MVTEIINPAKPQVLVVDDSKVVQWSINKMLENDYVVHTAGNAESALELLQTEENIALVFCDLQMPGMSGHQFLQKVREDQNPRLANLPIIVVSGEEDTDELKRRLLKEGATDIAHKPFDESEVSGRVAAYVNYQQQVMRMEQDVELDPISGLAGRNYFQLHVERNLTLATRHKTEFTLAVLEIDNYQAWLDELGNKVFFQLLFQVGKKIKNVIRTEDLAARIDQARIGLVLPLTNHVGGRLAVERVCREIDGMALKYAGESLKVSVSAGMSVFEMGSVLSTCGLVARAEEALRSAIERGGNCVIGMEQLDEQGYEEAEHTPVWVAEDPAIDLMREIQAGKTDGISEQELAQLLEDLRPVFELADRRLNTGFGQQLSQIS
jgi:diguanylate cyclase (GGDEF)-like protein